jgi:carbonic anhydrase/acetyltransferase-like protein (isoleucine patch superfamily)
MSFTGRRTITRRRLIKSGLLLGVGLPILPDLLARPSLAAATTAAPVFRAEEACHPTESNRPACPSRAIPETAAFIDPTADIVDAERVTLGPHVYIGPFARVLAGEGARIRIGEESNVQDNVTIWSKFERDPDAEARIEALGLGQEDGVEIAERCILAHGATVKGPARIGIGGGEVPVNPDQDQEVFLSFGCEVDGAILERNTGVSALARVGPGVRLRSGLLVLPGKNVASQAEADDPALGKVRLLTEADVNFNEAVLEVNVAFAAQYSRLFSEDASNLRGINYNPGNTSFTPHRHLPRLGGTPGRVPDFRNRIIGDVRLADPPDRLDGVLGGRIALRADEGEPFRVGHIRGMSDRVVFHALEHSDIDVGDNVSYGEGVIVHGGGRQMMTGGGMEGPTIVEDDVTLAARAVVFRSRIGRGSTVGVKSAVVNSDLAAGTVIPDRVIYLDDAILGPVEW